MALGDSLSYSYDALRRLVTKTDQLNDTTSYVYDLAGRMTSRLYKTGGTTLESTDTFTYDGASRLITCHKGRYNVTTTHSYAEDSMPASEAFTIDGKNSPYREAMIQGTARSPRHLQTATSKPGAMMHVTSLPISLMMASKFSVRATMQATASLARTL